MTFSTHRHIKRTRKSCRCVWCNETIDVGQPCDAQVIKWGRSDLYSIRFHPECWAAFCTLQIEEQESWGHGDFRRGCTCQAGTECRCKTRDTETTMRHLQEYMQ